MTTDKQALREAAQAINKKSWQMNADEEVVHVDSEGYENFIACSITTDVARFIAAASPASVLAVLDELDTTAHTAAVDHEAACSLAEENEELKRRLETAGKPIVELSGAANVNNQWKPDVCPVTGRQFFMWIEHPALGYVPTYGGPFDSYTIPTRDCDGEFSCERYDHDFGGWREGEYTGLYLTDDDEKCRVDDTEQRLAELESRTVTVTDPFYPDGDIGYPLAVNVSAVRAVCARAGIRCVIEDTGDE
ncbi:ead/Ea22-like family protein [Salmonella enterica]|nr:ead/Ea22-like family protein [Salmonella enterica]